MSDSLFGALCLAAVSVAAIHTLAPDHWMPFAAVARARRWSTGRTVRVTALSGLGHVTVSVLLGLLGLALGVELLEAVGSRMEAVAGILLIGFGLVYSLWGLRRAVGRHLPLHPHGHPHRHAAERDPSTATAWSLFVLFSLDPCVAVVPILFAAAPLGVARTLVVVLLYEAATLATMIALVLPARAGAQLLRAPWVERYGDAVAGGFIAGLGLFVVALGW